jgi:steroid delta-isomerase-like uncharacterized protein
MTNAKQIQRRFIDEVWNKGQLHTAYELLAPTVTMRSFGRDVSGFEGVAQMTATLRSAFPDLNMKVQEQIMEGDTVVARWNATGTNTGSLFGFAPTGKSINLEGHTIDRIQNGRIVSTFTSVDAMEMLLQVGIEPRIDMRKAVSQRMFAEVWSSGKFNVVDEIVAKDAAVGSRGDTGPDAVKAAVKNYRDALPDLTVEVLAQVAEGDAVTSTWVMRGHHRGTLMGIPPTGRYVSFTGSTIDHITDGKIKKTNVVLDVLELLTQLGAVIAPRS